MDLERMTFEFIERLLSEGSYKEAAVNLWHIAKHNRMRNLKNSLSENYHDAIELDIYKNSGAMDEAFLKSEQYLLEDELKTALNEIRRKDNLEIPFPKDMIFGYNYDEKKLSKKKKVLLQNRISKIRELGFEVEVNKAE